MPTLSFNKIVIVLIILGFSCQKSFSQKKGSDSKNTETATNKEEKSRFDCDYLGQKPPTSRAELFSPNFISTKVEHSAVMFTPNAKEMWFGRMYPAKIWYLVNKNGKWSDIRKAPLDDNYNYLYPFLSPDGNKLYFTSDRPITPGEERLGRGDGDLWYIERIDDRWSEPIHLGDSICFGNRHSIGSVSANGSIYYTVRTGKLYHYKTKMYYAEFKDGIYKTPILITDLNSKQPSNTPFVAPDENYIIFSSFRGGLGMSDLFISFKKEDGGWTKPKNLGPNINSISKDEYPYVTPDGKYLFFNSSRVSDINNSKIQNGPGNMFWVSAEFIEILKNKSLELR